MAVQAQLLGRVDGNTNYSTHPFVVGSGVTVTKGDFVYFASGVITSASAATQKLLGMALETATGNAAGTIKALVCVDPTMRYLIDGDEIGTALGATHPGTYFDLIGAGGAQLVDTSSTSTTGSLLLLQNNPQVDPVRSDTSVGEYVIAEHYFYPAQ
jgi:hypothetical protein